jgi:hypothetical protein
MARIFTKPAMLYHMYCTVVMDLNTFTRTKKKSVFIHDVWCSVFYFILLVLTLRE